MSYANQTFQVVVSDKPTFANSNLILGGIRFAPSKYDSSMRSEFDYPMLKAIGLRDKLIRMGYHPTNVRVEYSHLS